jgi:hypothetical protein
MTVEAFNQPMREGDSKAERTQSPAFAALRQSSRRLLAFVEHEIARRGPRSRR